MARHQCRICAVWPNITVKREPAPDAKEWQDKPDKPTCYRRTLAQVIEAGTSNPANGMARPCSAPRHGHPNALRGKTKIFYGPPPHAFISSGGFARGLTMP